MAYDSLLRLGDPLYYLREPNFKFLKEFNFLFDLIFSHKLFANLHSLLWFLLLFLSCFIFREINFLGNLDWSDVFNIVIILAESKTHLIRLSILGWRRCSVLPRFGFRIRLLFLIFCRVLPLQKVDLLEIIGLPDYNFSILPRELSKESSIHVQYRDFFPQSFL